MELTNFEIEKINNAFMRGDWLKKPSIDVDTKNEIETLRNEGFTLGETIDALKEAGKFNEVNLKEATKLFND